MPHLAFEFYHFGAYRNLLNVASRFGACRSVVDQAARYALLLHFRILIDFFFRSPKDDDVAVPHFLVLGGFADKYRPPEKIRNIEELRGHLNKLLAHFTERRWKDPRPDMSYYDRHFDAVEGCIAAFVRALPPDFNEDLIKAIERYRKRDELCG